MEESPGKLAWQGVVIAVQPRIKLTRSFDERQHTYLGYVLRVRGMIGDKDREFVVGVGKGAHAKHQFRAGDVVCGVSEPVADSRVEPVEFYKTSGLKVIDRCEGEVPELRPWDGVAPELETYRARGHRRLDARTQSASTAGGAAGWRLR